jgi:peptide/nickel transport system substrate-binding protein
MKWNVARHRARAALPAAALLAVVALAASPAMANRATDTLEVAFDIPFSGIEPYSQVFPYTEFIARAVFDGLVEYDPTSLSVKPVLATSWERLGNTIEFTVRDDVKWHDGAKFGVDDVVYTINWIVDPATRFREKWLWDWIDHAEAAGPGKVRLVLKRQVPYDLLLLSYTPIYPKHYHGAMTDKLAFGRKPIGTGPYRITQYDEAAGVVAVKNPDYHHGGEAKRPTNIGRMRFRYIPDSGTQMAQLLVGGIDFVRGLPAEQIQVLTKDPRFSVTYDRGISWSYMWFDAAGRGGVAALTDARVRRALAMAIDRKQMAQAIEGDRPIELPENMCARDRVIGCDYTKTVPDYDPDGARRLLAEAGYKDGFDLEITSYVGRSTTMAEAISGYFRAIGVRARIAPVTLTTFQQKAADGKLQIAVGVDSLRGIPDISRLTSFFFGTHDYTRDPALAALANAADTEMDAAKRREIARSLFDRVMDNTYVIPLNSLAQPFVHSNEVAIDIKSISSYGLTWKDLSWK